MNKIYVAEEHRQVLELWRKQGPNDIRLLHLDRHCDLRGLLIDRGSQTAYKITGSNSADNGNFLGHAFLEGMIRSIRWIHDKYGGRQNDIGTVKYKTDLSALPYRLMHFLKREPEIPICFDVIKYENWDNLTEGEHLDIDWDFFASNERLKGDIDKQSQEFLDRRFNYIPASTYICYSPQYSYPSRREFENFVTALAEKFKAKIIAIEPLQNRNLKKRNIVILNLRRILRKTLLPIVRLLKKIGVY